MKRIVCFTSLLALAAFLVLMGTPVQSAIAASNGQADWNGSGHQQTIRDFDQFLSNHPWIAHKLWEKPSRANSKDFQGDNPELKYWLENHPWARNQLRINARGFMDRVRDFERSGGRYSSYGEYGPWNSESIRAQMAQFSQFLDDHSGVAHQLAHNPSLVNDSGYLKHHKELRTFLDSHPAVRNRLSSNPNSFFAWYGSYDDYTH